MSAHPNNTPEQKAKWKNPFDGKLVGTCNYTRSSRYAPEMKAASKRDRHRWLVQRRKDDVPRGHSWRTDVAFAHSGN